MEVQIGSAKVAKYGTRESGDTLEVIERPQGGVSAVLADGQRSGRSAKIISNIVVRKAISLLGEGVRDGAAARATHDYLCTHRGGQVSAELQMVSVDLQTRSLVISRNSRCPVLVLREGEVTWLADESRPVGVYPNTKPVIAELPLGVDIYVLLHTDGLRLDEARRQACEQLCVAAAAEQADAQTVADKMLTLALEYEAGRPRDDISVLVLAVLPRLVPHLVRRLSLSFPVEGPRQSPP